MTKEEPDFAATAEYEYEEWLQNNYCEHKEIENIMDDDDDYVLMMCLYCGKVMNDATPRM